MTKCVAVDWAKHGIRVNAVAPTYIETPMTMADPANVEKFGLWKADTPLARMGRPSEIASAVLFLASPASSLITGTVLHADGGYTCW